MGPPRAALLLAACGAAGASNWGWHAAAPAPADYDRELDCALRELVFNRSRALLGDAADLGSVAAALQLSNCSALDPAPRRSPQRSGGGAAICPLSSPAALRVWVSPQGSDEAGAGDGTSARPFRTLQKARDAARAMRTAPGQPVDIALRAGTYASPSALQLGAADSGTRVAACPGETAVISGAIELPRLQFRRSGPGAATFTAAVPAAQKAALRGTDQLFVEAAEGDIGSRLVWAREPNGNAEFDLQPTGYALAQSNPAGIKPPPAGAGPVQPEWAPTPTRNNSWFPVYGRANDPRGGGNIVWLHSGGEASIYGDGRDFWNQTQPAALQWSPTPGTSHGFSVPVFNASGWPATQTDPKPLLHCMHKSEWGNHMWEVDKVDVAQRTFTLGRGGWQEGRYIDIGANPFYVEGARAALDAPGEWWLDEAEGQLWLIPNWTVSGDSFTVDAAAPATAVLVNISGGAAGSPPAKGISFEGVTFAHTRRTLMEPYVVPSPGDWSVHAGGVVTVSNAADISIRDCLFNRTGGNAVAFVGGVDRGSVTGNEMAFIGDSGVVLVGSLPGLGNDGSNASAPLTYPRDTVISGNHIHDIGLWGKQVSALFQAVSCRTTFSGNVVYNGPRAGLNINDGFCGGHNIQDNIFFNWVRETQDHGPINTWDRATYLQPHGGLYPQWNRVTRNLIMNGPSGNRDLGNLFPAVDNDDGSAYYWIAQNVVAYGGFKNFLGNDKVWIDNLVLYPGGRESNSGNGPCVMAWGGANEVYENNTCVSRGSGPGISAYPSKVCSYANETSRKVLLHLARNTYHTPGLHYQVGCGGQLGLKDMQALGEELGSVVAPKPPTAALAAHARALLRMGS
eukprot:TRINITY_DN64878_c0_g1_i1.p1 TRINITY_DN64878_c0_g1~~TRINITY_DN64878_c0_g1_i1.p1  ORF type:complete len:877 (+),score=269.51 TRINITY_DN64878_c0_g1_i1:79-2631(+)